jgi:hypothetical protein
MTFTCGTYNFLNCYILNYSGIIISETEARLKQERDTQGEITRVLVCGCVLVCSYSTTAYLSILHIFKFPPPGKKFFTFVFVLFYIKIHLMH